MIGSMEKIYIRHMAKALEQLPLSYQENSGQKMRMQGLKKRCQELTDKLTWLDDAVTEKQVQILKKTSSIRNSFF